MLGKFNQRGDTIIEVMIVLAVLGLALSISYATANRSLLNTRQAQENSEATSLVQSQVEALRYIARDTGSNVFTTLAPFCVNSSFQVKTTASDCLFKTGDSTREYKIFTYNCDKYPIQAPPAPDPCDGVRDLLTPNSSFVVQATWDDASGDLDGSGSPLKARVTQVYRYHPAVIP